MLKDEKKIKEEKRIYYELIEQINRNTDYLCAKQWYNYYFDRR